MVKAISFAKTASKICEYSGATTKTPTPNPVNCAYTGCQIQNFHDRVIHTDKIAKSNQVQISGNKAQGEHDLGFPADPATGSGFPNFEEQN